MGSVIAGGFIVAGMGLAAAQDDAAAEPSMPAFIEAGECSDLDANPVATLNNVEPIGASDEGEEERQVQGPLTASLVLTSTSEDVDLAFDDMLAETHSVTVHLSQEDLQTYVACGEIGGVVSDDQLVVALHEVDGSGYNGIAILSKDDDGNVDATLYLAGPREAEPAATPAS
jgi:hypothetical protein